MKKGKLFAAVFPYSSKKLPISWRRKAALSSSSVFCCFLAGGDQTDIGLVVAVEAAANSSIMISSKNVGVSSSSLVSSVTEEGVWGIAMVGASVTSGSASYKIVVCC